MRRIAEAPYGIESLPRTLEGVLQLLQRGYARDALAACAADPGLYEACRESPMPSVADQRGFVSVLDAARLMLQRQQQVPAYKRCADAAIGNLLMYKEGYYGVPIGTPLGSYPESRGIQEAAQRGGLALVAVDAATHVAFPRTAQGLLRLGTVHLPLHSARSYGRTSSRIHDLQNAILGEHGAYEAAIENMLRHGIFSVYNSAPTDMEVAYACQGPSVLDAIKKAYPESRFFIGVSDNVEPDEAFVIFAPHGGPPTISISPSRPSVRMPF
jgi:hypothetical protein